MPKGIGQPEAGTLEALLTAGPGLARFIPTHLGLRLPTPAIAALPIRSGSIKNSTYFPLTHQSFTDFDRLAVLIERHTTAVVRSCNNGTLTPASETGTKAALLKSFAEYRSG
ncbi:MAG TPA: hypothetical protein VLB04_05455 [Methanotrichaceae archaeon]|nr:hypothetical protein [Methanotrichaceae archaeon]